MKGGKDDEKIMGPLFPRLHVNDAEKGGPRAPPRNKMALYEQFSIPSQKKFNSGATSTLPLSSNNPSNLVPTASSSQGVGQERNMFSTFYISPPHSHSFENFRSHSHDGANSNTTRVDFEQTCSETRHLSSTAEFSSFHPDNFSKDSQNNGDEDDCRVPTFVRSETIPCGNGDQHDIDKQEFTTFRPPNPGSSTVTPRNSPLEPAASTFMSQIDVCDKPLKRTSSKVQKARQDMRNQRKENQTTRDFLEKRGSHPISRKNIGEPLKHADAASSQEHGDDPVDDLGRLYNVNAKIHQEAKNVLLPERTTNNEGITAEPVRRIDNGNVLMVMGGSCPGASFGDDNRSPIGAENGSGCHEAHGSLQIGDLDRCDDISETSMVDSISGLGISPDDVVGIIGQKHFWKARRAIASQQRVFAVQVFELHRLIKVQRLIAASPHLLLEDCDYFGNHSLDSSHAKKFPSEHIIKRPPQIVKQKDSEPPNQATEIADNKAVQKSCLTPHSDIIKGPINQHSIFGPYSSKPPPVAIDYKAGPWCFPQPGNQWLVPIMSPSDGLVYKPYSGPCPPTAGFMAPVYGGYVPPSLPPMAGDFMSTAYGVPAPHQQGSRILKGAPPVGHAYTPQYGIPVINRATSGTAVKAMSSFSGAQPHGQADRLSTGDVNFDTYYQSSCNISSQKSAAISCHVGKLQPSKDSEILGSTASSLSERAQGAEAGHEADGGDALPLFPMVPSFQVSDQSPQPHSNEQQTLVFKVVPHHPRSATESAARIFRSIQEERRHSDTA